MHSSVCRWEWQDEQAFDASAAIQKWLPRRAVYQHRKTIAGTKEAYYDALQKADQGWHADKNDSKPFIKYMLGIILACYREFEARIMLVGKAGAKSTSYDIVKANVSERIGEFSKQEVLAACPSLGSSSVESALKKLVENGVLVRIGSGRKTLYARADAVNEQ